METQYVLVALVAFASGMIVASGLAALIIGKLRAREAEIIKLKDSLEQRTVETEGAYARLRQVEMAKSQYMRKASHELQGPLATVETLLTVIRDGFLGDRPEKCGDLLERACVRVRDLQSVVNDLLVLSRAKDLSHVQEPAPIDVKQEISTVVSSFRPDAAIKDVDLLMSLPGEFGEFRGDPEAFRYLVSNLVSNAIRYTGKKGTVLVCAEGCPDCLHLVVSDTGIGIEPEHLDRIFDEFYRTKEAREMVRDGSGLGLAIVKAIVDANGGIIDVHSHPGEGTTFSVMLPRKDVPQADDEQPGITTNLERVMMHQARE